MVHTFTKGPFTVSGAVNQDNLGASARIKRWSMDGGGELEELSEHGDMKALATEPVQVKRTEPNVVCALAVLVAGPAFDALCALPGVVLDDLPASLRATGMVLVVMLGSPPLRKDGMLIIEQRIVLATLLAACAFLGLNAAEVRGRNADAVFALVSTLASVAAISTGGVNEQTDTSHTASASRENLSALCGSLLFYLGMRTTRHAFALPSEVLNFKVSHEDVSVRGYAVAPDMVVAGNAFAGSTAAAFGATLLLNHHIVLHVGSAAMSTVAGTLACFVFLGSLVAQMASYAIIEQLPALFSDVACDGSVTECAAAYRARRFLVSSTSTTTNWICAISMATFAFSNHRRFTERRHTYLYQAPLSTVEGAAVLATSFAACILVIGYTDPIHSMLFSEVELLLLIASIPCALFGWTILATGLHTAGQVGYVYSRVTTTGFLLSYFTHWSIAATLLLTVATGVLAAVGYLLYVPGERRMYSEPVEYFNGLVLTALVSVQTFLTLGTLGMSSGYSGCFYTSNDHGWRSTGYQYLVQHSCSFFFVAALYASRHEHHLLSKTARRVAYFAGPTVLGICWLVTILTDTAAQGANNPYTVFVDVGSFLIGVSAAGVAWLGVGLALDN